jgi:hypothetical protein
MMHMAGKYYCNSQCFEQQLAYAMNQEAKQEQRRPNSLGHNVLNPAMQEAMG